MTRTSTRTVRSTADRLELALLEDAEQLDLESRGQVADLVQEDRPAVGELEAAHAVARWRR